MKQIPIKSGRHSQSLTPQGFDAFKVAKSAKLGASQQILIHLSDREAASILRVLASRVRQ